MKIIHVSNPRWLNEAHTCVMVEVEFEGQEVMPFQASLDAEGMSGALFDQLIAGDFGEIDAYIPSAPSVPASVTDIQMRLALDASDLLDDVERYVDQSPRSVKIWWERATTIERTNPMVVDAISAVGKTPAEGDMLFILAGGF